MIFFLSYNVLLLLVMIFLHCIFFVASFSLVMFFLHVVFPHIVMFLLFIMLFCFSTFVLVIFFVCWCRCFSRTSVQFSSHWYLVCCFSYTIASLFLHYNIILVMMHYSSHIHIASLIYLCYYIALSSHVTTKKNSRCLLTLLALLCFSHVTTFFFSHCLLTLLALFLSSHIALFF